MTMSSLNFAASSLNRLVSRSHTAVSKEGTAERIITFPFDSSNGFTEPQPGTTQVNSGAVSPTCTSSPSSVANLSPSLKTSVRTVVILLSPLLKLSNRYLQNANSYFFNNIKTYR